MAEAAEAQDDSTILVPPETACLHMSQPAMLAGGPACQALAARLFKAVKAHKGWGLAAPQLGVSASMAVVTLPATGIAFCMVNPVIKQLSGKMDVAIEACLSLPGVQAYKMRREYIQVVFQDERGKYHMVETGGLLSRVIQHEIAHLRGLLITDGTTKAAPLRGVNEPQPEAHADGGNSGGVGEGRQEDAEPVPAPDIQAPVE